MKKECLVFVIENLVGGGAEKVVLTLTAEISRQGYDVHIVLLDKEQDYDVPAGVEPHHLDSGRENNKNYLEFSAKRLEKLLKDIENKSDTAVSAVVSNMIKSDQIVEKLRHYRTFFCIHNNTSLRELTSSNPFKRYLVRQKLRTLYADKNIIAVSRGVGDDMIKNFGTKREQLQIIYNPVDIQGIKKQSQKAQELPFDDFIIHVGSFKKQKRHDRLFEAYKQSGIEVPLVVLGKGSTSRTKYLKQLCTKMAIDDRVYFAGFQKNPYPWIARAKMLVLSSDCEGFALVIAEALVCGTPVASVDCPSGPAEILQGDLARCLSEKNTASLARVMREVYRCPPVVNEQQVHRFAVQTVAQQYLAL